MAIPDEKYQNSPTGGQAFPDEGAKAPLCPPVAPRLKVDQFFQRRVKLWKNAISRNVKESFKNSLIPISWMTSKI